MATKPVVAHRRARVMGKRRMLLVMAVLAATLFAPAPAAATLTPEGSWGTASFRQPWGIATDAGGNVYAAEVSNQRISKFAADGTLLTRWGSSGSGVGQLQFPNGVAVDSHGDVFVAETNNHRVQKFTSEGVSLDIWGSSGSGAGQLMSPWGIATDSDDNLYVAERSNHRIQKFNSAGESVATWGSLGTDDGKFNQPVGVAVDSAGNVYVVDEENARVQKFDASGTFVAKWGTPGSGQGQFSRPSGITIDASDRLYVVDSGARRVQKFDVNGQYLAEWGSSGSGDGQLNVPQDIAADASGNIYVADTGNNRVHKFTSNGTFVAHWGPALVDGEFLLPEGVAADGLGHVYVADTGNHRIQKFTDAGGFVRTWGTSGAGNGQFSQPGDVAADSAGNVYVTDTGNHRIQKFNGEGVFVAAWGGVRGSEPGQFQSPRGLAVDEAGNVYVADTGNHRIQKLDASGAVLATWGELGSGDGQFQAPFDVALGAAGVVYVADGVNDRIQKLDSAGGFLLKWTSGDQPIGIAVDHTGEVFVSEENRRIARYSANGSLIAAYGSFGSGEGQFANVRAIAVDPAGYLYAADMTNNRIQKLSVTTHELSVAKAGAGSGTVTSNLAGLDCGTDCSESYRHATSVTLTATPQTGSSFTGWSGACTGTGSCQVTMTQARDVTATFQLQTHALTVGRDGSGTGAVTSSPAGIDCGLDCSQHYDHGTVVTLTASPASDSSFGGWSGSCLGTAPCQVTMDAAKSVTATFSDATAPTSAITFPGQASYTEPDWDSGCSGAGGLCGTAGDNRTAITGVQWSVQDGAGNYWNGSSFAATAPVLHAAAVSSTSATTANWFAAFPFTNFPTDGNYTLTVQATDAAGNTETGSSVTFAVDVNWMGSITIIQATDPDDVTGFDYSGDLGTFVLTDDGTPETASITFDELSPGTYVVQQAKEKGWQLDAIDCGSTAAAVHLKSRTVTIDFVEGDEVECTFRNVSGKSGGKPDDNPGKGPNR